MSRVEPTLAARLPDTSEEIWVVRVPLPEDDRLNVLTPAEREICHCLIQGLPYRRIAEQRSVSVRTVSNQVNSVYRKLEVTSRTELASLLSTEEEPGDWPKSRQRPSR